MIRIDITPEQQREIEAHWAKVRAGLRNDTPHEFKADVTPTVDMHRHLASRHIEIAAGHARAALALAVAEGGAE